MTMTGELSSVITARSVNAHAIPAIDRGDNLRHRQATRDRRSPIRRRVRPGLVTEADFDNVSVARLFDPVTRPAPVPRPGMLLAADEFAGGLDGDVRLAVGRSRRTPRGACPAPRHR
ncbi:hypothetical protein HD597_000229 [Nonomuraea thailandensis]|uniref:Uncharacterized protein n=1 Tax=Nonomuraea thailandensis TaxID=1188745 RepID=A0A9X2G9D9_9ACTN|nr:hypothetical protein [Nonomuraea thailandensis]MCP2353209.1 hypothetical protein [Nonomuraea thailandensis]